MKLTIAFCCLVAVSVAAEVSVLRSDQTVNPDGYQFAYEFDNGVKAEETGSLKDPETLVAQGQFAYVSPEGEQISLQYVADENGFQPQGSHLPTPPPIPEVILRSIEYIKAHAIPENQK